MKDVDKFDHCLYWLLDPSRNDRVFYIGIGSLTRYKDHYRRYNMSIDENVHKVRVIKRYRNLGFQDKHRIVCENLSKIQAEQLEIYLIKLFGRTNDKTGFLTNIHLGGSKPPTHYGSANIFHGIKPWNAWSATKNSLIAWQNADRLFEQYQLQKCGYINLCKYFSITLELNFPKYVIHRMILKFKQGWIPTEDEDWISFKREFDNGK